MQFSSFLILRLYVRLYQSILDEYRLWVIAYDSSEVLLHWGSTNIFQVYPNPWKIHSYLGNPNLSESLDIGRCIFYRGSEPIKRTNTKGTQILIWKSRAIHPSAQPDEKGTLDRTECSLITQGHRRLYFHTHSNMPVRACEFEVDSEDDR